jgi:hypothetical protein
MRKAVLSLLVALSACSCATAKGLPVTYAAEVKPGSIFVCMPVELETPAARMICLTPEEAMEVMQQAEVEADMKAGKGRL